MFGKTKMTIEQRLEEVKARITDNWKNIDCSEDWNYLILECHEKLMEIDPNYTIFQIKEKFGGLRFYFDTITTKRSEMQTIVNQFETASFDVPHKH